jgi:hypothetical protein
MSEERPQHPQEPAEGDDENVEAPGADQASSTGRTPGSKGKPSVHPQEPAEGAEEDVKATGADRTKDEG